MKSSEQALADFYSACLYGALAGIAEDVAHDIVKGTWEGVRNTACEDDFKQEED